MPNTPKTSFLDEVARTLKGHAEKRRDDAKLRFEPDVAIADVRAIVRLGAYPTEGAPAKGSRIVRALDKLLARHPELGMQLVHQTCQHAIDLQTHGPDSLAGSYPEQIERARNDLIRELRHRVANAPRPSKAEASDA